MLLRLHRSLCLDAPGPALGAPAARRPIAPAVPSWSPLTWRGWCDVEPTHRRFFLLAAPAEGPEGRLWLCKSVRGKEREARACGRFSLHQKHISGLAGFLPGHASGMLLAGA